MTITEKVYSALSGNDSLTSLLAKGGIYHLRSPDAGSYPIVVYSMVSDVPTVKGDDEELAHTVTVRIHIVTKDARYSDIYREVLAAMKPIGGVRSFTQEIWDKDLNSKIVDFDFFLTGEEY